MSTRTAHWPVPSVATLVALVMAWATGAPAFTVRFSVPAGGAVTQAFTVTAGKGTYSAHYPIHAYARFTLDGKPRTAHPILILRTELADPPRVTRPLAFTPVTAPSNGQLSLWSVPIYRAVIAPLGKEPQVMPVGWQGSEPTNRASVNIGPQTLGGDGRSVMFLHPPWFAGQPGHILVEWPLVLPKTTPQVMHFANGINEAATGGDGVTFRVRVLAVDAPAGQEGEIVFDRHTAAKTWQEASVDLSRFAGKTVRLQIESHPGPKNDTSWDHSYWAEPRLVIGEPPKPMAFPPKDATGSRLLGTLARGRARYEVRLWPGRRGLFDATIAFSDGTRQLAFHGFEARVFGDEISRPGSPTLLVEAVEEPTEGGYQVRHRMKSLLGSFDLVGRLAVERDTLRTAFRLENTPPAEPWQACYLEDLAVGPWSATAERIYAGPGNVIREPKAPFDLGFDGHRLATSFVGFDFEPGMSLVEAVDVPCNGLTVRPADRHYSIHVPHASTLTFIPAENVWDAVKVWRNVNGLKPGGGVQKVAGRFVFDLWGGRYSETADALEKAFRYGLTDAMVVWHNWQRWGYDYRLPDIYPPNPQFGTLEDIRRLARVCREHDVVFAPHDNYIDLYPDADGFSYEKQIAFYQNGQPVRAWLNEGRDAQAYRYRSDAIEPLLRRNLQLIRDNFAATGYFIDVWSSAGPYDYWTADGRFVDRQYTRGVWASQFAWIRDFLGGNAPQISESGHDQLVGWLDGSQTNHLRVDQPATAMPTWFVWSIACADAERIPWFDAAHHDRFVCHGAGYPSRYEGGLDPRTHGIDSDDYIATEVLTGHPGMVSRTFDRDVVRKYWLLRDLMRALALRTIDGVEFVGDDVDGGNLHRQHVRWSGGGEVWVNRGKTDWTVAGATLPEFGFLARVCREHDVVFAPHDNYIDLYPDADGFSYEKQ
ncbi:MAG: hypothetical protein NTW96_21205, partial [Planctomycetia bacterium]|nr:hypothetical protein [Planctomycetia bacterium]